MRNLITYWPPIIAEVREFKEIADATDPENESLTNEISSIYDDQFIKTATERGIAIREKMLKIEPKADHTLEDRRFIVLSRYNKQLPYTVRKLEEILISLLGEEGYSIIKDFNNYEIKIIIELEVKAQQDEVAETLNKMKPANMIGIVEILYNQYFKIGRFTYGDLAAYTYKEVREKILDFNSYDSLSAFTYGELSSSTNNDLREVV